MPDFFEMHFRPEYYQLNTGIGQVKEAYTGVLH